MRRKKFTWLWFFAAAIFAVMFGIPAFAGDLNPTAPPGPTMRPLSEVSQPWDQVLPASERFKLVMGGTAVLDKETGLVWEKSPSPTPIGTSGTAWYEASLYCLNLATGGHKGWRLPAAEELASLVDTTVSGPLYLPNGHPFSNVQSYYYFTSTDRAANTTGVRGVNFGSGSVGYCQKDYVGCYTWCVRGGKGHDTE